MLSSIHGSTAAGLMHRIKQRFCSRYPLPARYATLVGALAVLLHGTIALADPLPNIVYILADDMGLGDVRSYTANSQVNTPNIDRIANAGMLFNDAHSSSSVCTPSRYSLLTGRYTWRTNVLGAGVVQPYQNALIEPSRLTVAEMLQQSGYSTGAFGKWHLGGNWVTTNGGAAAQNGSNVNHSQPFTGGPVDNGFDTFFGVEPSVNDPPYAFVRDRNTVGNDLVTPTSPTGQVYGNPSNPSSNRIGPIVPGYDITNALPIISNEAVSYIGQKANQANPFFMYYPMTAPHEPVVPPSFAIGQSGVTGPKQGYGDFIWAVDWAVGQVLNKLEDPDGNPNTNDSILNNTIVVFATDNGAETGISFANSPGNINGQQMRGDKAELYEGGHRIPFMVQWNGHVAPGTVNNDYVELTDFMATVADVVDYSLPSGAAEDSFNILPELAGNGSASVRSSGINHSYQGSFAIRQTDEAGNQWKMLFTNGNGGYEDPIGRFNPTNVITDFTKVQLFNLKNDPTESANLLAGGGTLAMQRKALQLQGMLQDRILSGRSSDIPAKTVVNGTSKILIDFGDATRQTLVAGWNNIAGATDAEPLMFTYGLPGKGLYDDGGGYSGIVFKTTWVNTSGDPGDYGVASLVNAYNGPYPASLNGIPSTALSDGFFVRDGNKLVINLESLDAHATYDLEFYGAASAGPTYSLFTITGGSTQQVQIAPLVNNSTLTALVTGMMPDSLNRIIINFEGRRADGSLEDPGVANDAGGFLNFLRIVEHLLEVPGDFNNDRIVDSADYYAWRSAFGTTGTSAADGNHDGVVDGNDYIIWRKSMSANGAGSGSVASQLPGTVPEPTSAVLLTIAMTSLMLYTSRGSRISRPNLRA